MFKPFTVSGLASFLAAQEFLFASDAEGVPPDIPEDVWDALPQAA